VLGRFGTPGRKRTGGLVRAFERRDLPVEVTGDASLFCVHFSGRPVTDYRSLAARDERRNREFFLRMLNHGVLLAPRGLGALSTPMGEAELTHFLAAAERVAEEMAASGG
jgi:glutamate-1-semialdehyde 2,1-aminomutase